MTIKEIAEAAGVSAETVRAKGKELCPSRFENGKKTELNQKEAIMVMSELRKKGFISPTENLQVNESEIDSAFKLAIITLTGMAQNLDARMTRIETRIEQRQALLPPPQIKPRDHISMIIREYATRIGIDYAGAWSELYRQFGYRTNSNPSISARNRGMKIIDYIDTEGQIETLESIALELFGKR